MPSIKDESTVKAIAREFTSNGRKKGPCLETIGYSDSYSIDSGRGCKVVFSNVRVIAAIKAIDDKTSEKYELKAEKVIARLSKIGGLIESTESDKVLSTTSADQIRSLDLLGKHLKLWDRTGEAGKVDTATLIDPELELELRAVANRYKLRKANAQAATGS